jgi:single-strand DNA-binding protein
MAGLNRIIVTGRLVRDPEIRYIKEEVPTARFTIQVNFPPSKKDTDKIQELNCVAWRGLATIVGEYLKKGSLVAIEGKLSINKISSASGKKKETKTEIVIDNMLVLDKKFYAPAAGTMGPDEVEEALADSGK